MGRAGTGLADAQQPEADSEHDLPGRRRLNSRRPEGVVRIRSPRRRAVPAYTPPPPTVSPDEQAAFGRPGRPARARRSRRRRRTGCLPQHVDPVAPVRSGIGRDVRPHRDRHRRRVRPAARHPDRRRPAVRPSRRGGRPTRIAIRGAIRARRPGSAGRRSSRPGSLEQLDPEADTEQDDDCRVARRRRAEAGHDRPDRRAGRFGLSGLLLALIVALVAGDDRRRSRLLLADRTHDALHNSDVSLAKTATAANRPPGSVADIATAGRAGGRRDRRAHLDDRRHRVGRRDRQGRLHPHQQPRRVGRRDRQRHHDGHLQQPADRQRQDRRPRPDDRPRRDQGRHHAR